ncbi:MAG: hypothetical protein JWM53_704 [bacterium]|nr:hypothetical protein [bacterium]
MRMLAMVLVIVLSAPSGAEEAQPRVVRKPDLRYVVSGAVVFGFFYLLPLALSIRYEEGELSVPVLGPLIELRRCRDCTANSVEQGVVAGLVLDAVLQAAGASLFVLGMIRRKPTRLSVAPTPSGFVVGGRF